MDDLVLIADVIAVMQHMLDQTTISFGRLAAFERKCLVDTPRKNHQDSVALSMCALGETTTPNASQPLRAHSPPL
eukprot:1261789-Amphidinium_carterae.2